MHSSVGMEQLMRTFSDAKKAAVLILSTNRGMVGSLNTNLLSMLQKDIAQTGLQADFITYGRKGGM